jgi:hypothetical protein
MSGLVSCVTHPFVAITTPRPWAPTPAAGRIRKPPAAPTRPERDDHYVAEQSRGLPRSTAPSVALRKFGQRTCRTIGRSYVKGGSLFAVV